MSWRLDFRPEVREDVATAARWYESREAGLGKEFIEEIIKVWDEISKHPLLGGRRHPSLDVRWRYPERFPYRVIYAVDEEKEEILVIAVLHAARHDQRWRSRTL